MRYVPLLLALATLPACDRSKAPSAPAPSKAELIAHESDLLKLTLTPEAQKRLGIQTSPVSNGSSISVREAAGEIVVPPTSAGGMPTGSLSNLQQIGAQQAAADGEVARATAQARLSRIAFNRAEALVREEAGSARARDEAGAALAAADAALGVAREQRRLLGPSVSSMGSQSRLWVRVSIFGSDLATVQRGASVKVSDLGGRGTSQTARPVQGVPSANATTGTVDLFYALSNPGNAFRIGQRVAVDVPIQGQTTGLSIPSAAILRDIYGGEWVYQKTAENVFVRQRVEIVSETGGRALLSRGLTPSAKIVTVGAAELFGTEFGAAH
jgi:hypothetical protein